MLKGIPAIDHQLEPVRRLHDYRRNGDRDGLPARVDPAHLGDDPRGDLPGVGYRERPRQRTHRKQAQTEAGGTQSSVQHIAFIFPSLNDTARSARAPTHRIVLRSILPRMRLASQANS